MNSLSIRHVDGLAHVATVAGAEEQSLRDEYEACMQRALMMLMGGKCAGRPWWRRVREHFVDQNIHV